MKRVFRSSFLLNLFVFPKSILQSDDGLMDYLEKNVFGQASLS